MKIGIIGGSGLDNPDILEEVKEIEVETPFGKPSSLLKEGKIKGVDVVLLARHGREHTIPPTQVNFRANIHALKERGCDYILATTACGSLRAEIERGDFVILDQFIDFTRHRKITFYEEFPPGGENAKHTAMAEPFSEELRNALIKSAEKSDIKHHKKGTVITIEGPRFSTKAESKMFRLWGADVINMSVAPEAILANEMGIPYAAVAMSTDYDTWMEDEEGVMWEEILKVFGENVEKVTKLLVNAIENLKEPIKSKIRTIPNWPKEGVMFRDITTLIDDPEGFNMVTEKFVNRYKGKGIDKIVGIESRGFIFGSVLAQKLGIGFVPIRKKGKLPAETEQEEYELEYGKDVIEIHKDAVSSGMNVLVIDDLIATGGTALAACNLVRKLGGNVIECGFVIDLPDVGGRKKLENSGYKVFSLVEFEGD